MTHKPAFFTAAFAAAFVFALGLGTAPAPAQAQSILAPADTGGSSSNNRTRSRAAPATTGQDTYGGIVSAPPQQRNNPYKAPPAENIYDFVQDGGDKTTGSIEDGRLRAQEMRQARTRARQKENLQRSQQQRAEWDKVRQEGEKKQRELMEEARRNGALPYGQ